MKLLVVGAGSVGGYFGGRLAQAGRDVTFLARPARAAQLRSRGLEIVSPYGDVTLQPKVVTADALDGPYDAIILSVKAYALDAAVADLAPAVGPDTMILPVLNGMRHVDVLTARFDAHAVAGCACKVATILDGEGRIIQLSKLQDFAYGEMDGTRSERIERLDQTLTGAGFTARLSPVIAREMWEKWTLLAALGGITCLMRGNIGEIEAAPGGRDFSLAFLDEVVSVISAAGVPPSAEFLAMARAQLTEKGSAWASSMYRDLQNDRPVEADQILGDLSARGAKAGIPTPLISASYANLSIYAQGLKA
ncbi:ketopantoate reductase family protein [Aquabacter sp. CN5-332]|uniref:ketopantoate reductase family protein n=1 Tax=Aquabacter sp. CN5-332 TaxID=3156608 RepID=UPI0032B418E3